jgi:hypothetical protein
MLFFCIFFTSYHHYKCYQETHLISAASVTYAPHPINGGIVNANEYIHIKMIETTARLVDEVFGENGNDIK